MILFWWAIACVVMFLNVKNQNIVSRKYSLDFFFSPWLPLHSFLNKFLLCKNVSFGNSPPHPSLQNNGRSLSLSWIVDWECLTLHLISFPTPAQNTSSHINPQCTTLFYNWSQFHWSLDACKKEYINKVWG